MGNNLFNLSDRIVIITGGCGLLGLKHAEAVLQYEGIPVLLDISDSIDKKVEKLQKKFNRRCLGFKVDITSEKDLFDVKDSIISQYGSIDVLINNAANDPKVDDKQKVNFSRLENFPLEQWKSDFDVGVTGAFICCKVFGPQMVKQKKGVILNVASDLSVIAPDQRLYEKDGLDSHQQSVKPVSYSIVKTALIGLTRYLATYWVNDGIRANAISPGGIYTNQNEEFLSKVKRLIPMNRMAKVDDYQGSVIFLISDASSYMTGQNLIVDGGRSCW